MPVKFAPWQRCVASETRVETQSRTCRFEEEDIRAITRRPFSIAEQPICCTDERTGLVTELERTLRGLENSELFGAELSVTFAPNGRQVVSGSDMGIIKIWDEQQRDKIKILKGHYTGWVNTIVLASSPDGKRLISGGEDGRLKIWHLLNLEVLTLAGSGKHIHSVTFEPGGQGVVYGLADGSICLWDWSTSKQAQKVHILKEHTKWVHSILFAPDGRCLASGSGDATIRLWNWVVEKDIVHVQTVEVPASDVYCLSFSADSRHLAFGLAGGIAGIWSIGEGKMRTLQADSNSIRAVAFNPADDTVALGLCDGTIDIWDWKNQKVKTVGGHAGTVWSVAFSPDGKRLVSGASDECLRIWKLAETSSPDRVRRERD